MRDVTYTSLNIRTLESYFMFQKKKNREKLEAEKR
jgi:hypothetical protein